MYLLLLFSGYYSWSDFYQSSRTPSEKHSAGDRLLSSGDKMSGYIECCIKHCPQCLVLEALIASLISAGGPFYSRLHGGYQISLYYSDCVQSGADLIAMACLYVFQSCNFPKTFCTSDYYLNNLWAPAVFHYFSMMSLDSVGDFPVKMCHQL